MVHPLPGAARDHGVPVILAIVGTRKFANPDALAYARIIIGYEVMRLKWHSGKPVTEIMIS